MYARVLSFLSHCLLLLIRNMNKQNSPITKCQYSCMCRIISFRVNFSMPIIHSFTDPLVSPAVMRSEKKK